MPSPRLRFSSRPSAPRLSRLALALLVAAFPALAMDVVIDPSHINKTVQAIYELQRQYMLMQSQLEEMQRQYAQQLIGSLPDGYQGQGSLQMQLAPRALNYGVSERCNTNRNPAPQQRLLCTMIVQTQNQQFNTLVQVQQLNSARQAELAAIYAERAKIPPEEAGRLQANNNRLSSFQSRMQVDLQNSQIMLEAYDQQLRVLNDEHAREADKLLDGSAGESGSTLDAIDSALKQSAMRAAMLKAAFAAAGMRDR